MVEGGRRLLAIGAVEGVSLLALVPWKGGDAFYIYIHMITARGNSSYVQAVCHAKSPHKRVGSSLPMGGSCDGSNVVIAVHLTGKRN